MQKRGHLYELWSNLWSDISHDNSKVKNVSVNGNRQLLCGQRMTIFDRNIRQYDFLPMRNGTASTKPQFKI